MKTNLVKLTTFGIIWTGLSQFILQAFRFIVIIILARLLSPDDFGIVAMAAIFIGFINTINELGLSASIIQKKNIEETHLSTSFWMSVGISIFLCFFCILASPFVADFFNDDLVQPVLIVTSLGLIIGSFCIVHKALLEKNLNFKKIAIIEIIGSFISGFTSIVLAFYNYGVWSLVFGQLLGNFVSALIFWTTYSWKPSFTFSFKHFIELFKFGGHVMGSRILNYTDSNIDYLIVGKVLGTSALGYYSFAYHLITFPLHKISMIVTRVTFPAFSTIQDDNDTLRKGYLKVVRYISVITFPMLAGMIVVAPEFVVVVYGAKWAPMILPLQILCLAGALKSIGTTVGSVLLSKGRADLQLKWNIFTLIVLSIAIFLGANYGITGVAAAITIMTIILFPIIQIITNRLIDLSVFDYCKAIYPTIIASLFVIVSVEIYQKIVYVYDIPLIVNLISSIVVGICIYILILRILFNNIFKEIQLLIHGIRR